MKRRRTAGDRTFARDLAPDRVLRRWAIGALLCSGCWSAKLEPPAISSAPQSTRDLIGGFAAADPALNAVGSMSLMYSDGLYETFDLVCSGSLIDSDTVLTAKHCIEAVAYYADYGYSVVFSVGSSSFTPLAWSEVIALQGAPGDFGGFNGYGHDVAVLQLATPIADAPTLQLGTLAGADLGQNFVGIGFGDLDNHGTYGTRRVGTVTLRANMGPTYGVLLGGFAAFYEWYWGEPLPPECANAPALGGGIIVGPVIGAGAGSPPPSAAGGRGGGDDDAGAGADCTLASYAREVYDATLLEEQSEVVAGGAPGNAQPCFGDSGSPLLRLNAAQQLVAYGVVSGGLGSSTMICDYGAVYAGLTEDVVDFLERAKAWVDPCKGMVFRGFCEGSLAQRCSTLSEGERRKLSFDCAAVALPCLPQADGSVGCGSADRSLEPPAPARSGETPATPRSLLEPVFRKPVR